MTRAELTRARAGDVIDFYGRRIELDARPQTTEQRRHSNIDEAPWRGYFTGWDAVTGVRVRQMIDVEDLAAIRLAP